MTPPGRSCSRWRARPGSVRRWRPCSTAKSSTPPKAARRCTARCAATLAAVKPPAPPPPRPGKPVSAWTSCTPGWPKARSPTSSAWASVAATSGRAWPWTHCAISKMAASACTSSPTSTAAPRATCWPASTRRARPASWCPRVSAPRKRCSTAASCATGWAALIACTRSAPTSRAPKPSASRPTGCCRCGTGSAGVIRCGRRSVSHCSWPSATTVSRACSKARR